MNPGIETNPVYERFFQVVNPKDKIKVESIKDNQLVWCVSHLTKDVSLNRYVQHPWNPYCVLRITKFIPDFIPNIRYGNAAVSAYGKDKLYMAHLYTATEEALIMMKLDHQFNIPEPIDVEKWKEEKLHGPKG